MKKILFFFIFLLLLGCAADKQQYNIVSCPDILFSKENKVYITSTQQPITNENLDYRAIINNLSFSKECLLSNNILETKLSLLFIVQPENVEQDIIVLPYFVAIIDNQDNVIDLQYYRVEGNFNRTQDNSSYIETEIIDTQNINIKYKNNKTSIQYKFLVGFLLDEKKINLLN